MSEAERATLLARYRDGADEVSAALEDITDEELDRRPAPGDWTAREVVHHLADSEATAYVRLRRLIAEDEPLIQGYDEPEYARRLHYDRPIDSSLAVLRAVRQASLDLLESLSETEWARTGRHSESGPYSVDRWLEIYASHSHDHANQIREARATAAS
jgi:predicted NBD/HSP70 family sugar kinase